MASNVLYVVCNHDFAIMIGRIQDYVYLTSISLVLDCAVRVIRRLRKSENLKTSVANETGRHSSGAPMLYRLEPIGQ